MSTKLHELLGVKAGKESEIDKLMKAHIATFKGSHHLFQRTKKVFRPATEEANGAAADVVEEDKPLVTTVAKETNFVLTKFGECLDLLYTIDRANNVAAADIVVDGATLASNVPATFLVHLEKRLNQVIELIDSMATADPAAGFTVDAAEGKNVLQAQVLVRPRTAKIEEYVVVVQPTKEHPAHVVKTVKDVVTGQVSTYQWSGLPTTEQKSQLKERAVKLKEAVVAARARANCVEIKQEKIFSTLKDYLLVPIN